MAKEIKTEENQDVEVKINEPKKSETIKVCASFITKDLDGLKTKHEYVGEGKTVAEAINVKNKEDDSDFPKGCNCLVNTIVQKGASKIEKALAPHKARAIFEFKKVEVFEAVYRGL